jgi:hypothetical protein
MYLLTFILLDKERMSHKANWVENFCTLHNCNLLSPFAILFTSEEEMFTIIHEMKGNSVDEIDFMVMPVSSPVLQHGSPELAKDMRARNLQVLPCR